MLAIIVLSNCAGPGYEHPYRVMAKPFWFDVDERFKPESSVDIGWGHPFFDLVPFTSVKDRQINFFLVTPVDSEHNYSLDLNSGRRYRTLNYCPAKDVWGSYENDLKTPPYSVGIIPRVLDQRGNPQKILIFGDLEYIATERRELPYSQRARIVGGITRQYCQSYPCRKNKKWVNNTLLIGVSMYDPFFEKVDFLSELKKEVDWKEVKAFIENGDGVDMSGGVAKPAFRIVREFEGTEVLKKVVDRGRYFTYDEIKLLRDSCHKLYDFTWRSVQRIRSQEKQTGDALFQPWFWEYYQKYGDRYGICSRFVRSSNNLEDAERFWFFTHFEGFYKLEELQQIYDCGSQTWINNRIRSDGTRPFSYNKDRFCKDGDFNRPFEIIGQGMLGLRALSSSYARFITYDFGVGGSHEKVYSWSMETGLRTDCPPKFQVGGPTIPPKVFWKKFNVDKVVIKDDKRLNKNDARIK